MEHSNRIKWRYCTNIRWPFLPIGGWTDVADAVAEAAPAWIAAGRVWGWRRGRLSIAGDCAKDP